MTVVTGKSLSVLIGGRPIAYADNITVQVKPRRYVKNVKWLPGGKAEVNSGGWKAELISGKWTMQIDPFDSYWKRPGVVAQLEKMEAELEYRWLKKLEHEILGAP